MFRQAVTVLLGFFVPCLHRRQTIAGRRLGSGIHEMFLVCSRCGKRVSPGVRLGAKISDLPVTRPASPAALAATKWLPG